MENCDRYVKLICNSKQQVAQAILSGACRSCLHWRHLKNGLLKEGFPLSRHWCLPANNFVKEIKMSAVFCQDLGKTLSVYLYLRRLAIEQLCPKIQNCQREIILLLKGIAKGQKIASQPINNGSGAIEFKVIGGGVNEGEFGLFIKKRSSKIIINSSRLYNPQDLDHILNPELVYDPEDLTG